MVRQRKYNHMIKQSGFTLIELMVSLALFGVVIIAVFGFWRFVNQNYSFSFDQSRAVDQAERAVAYLTRELRQVRASEIGAYGLEQADDQALTFYADVDGDGQAERVRYWLDGDLIRQGVIQPSGSPVSYPSGSEKVTIIVSDVVNGTNPLFYYYNGDWPADVVNNPLLPASRLLSTRYVRAEVAVRVGDSTQSPTVQVSSGAMLRGLKTNM
jgi:prepilin-type N-terminal cleavage/methylation domain-containing protein